MLSIVCRNVRTEHLLNNTHRNHIHWRFNFMKTNVKSLVKVIVALSIAVIMTLALFALLMSQMTVLSLRAITLSPAEK